MWQARIRLLAAAGSLGLVHRSRRRCCPSEVAASSSRSSRARRALTFSLDTHILTERIIDTAAAPDATVVKVKDAVTSTSPNFGPAACSILRSGNARCCVLLSGCVASCSLGSHSINLLIGLVLRPTRAAPRLRESCGGPAVESTPLMHHTVRMHCLSSATPSCACMVACPSRRTNGHPLVRISPSLDIGAWCSRMLNPSRHPAVGGAGLCGCSSPSHRLQTLLGHMACRQFGRHPAAAH